MNSACTRPMVGHGELAASSAALLAAATAEGASIALVVVVAVRAANGFGRCLLLCVCCKFVRSAVQFAVMESSPVLPGIPPPATATSPTAAGAGGERGMSLMGGVSMMGDRAQRFRTMS